MSDGAGPFAWSGPPFAADDVEILAQTREYSGFFALDRYRLRHRRYDGEWTEPMYREVFVTGDAVVVLPYDPVRDAVVLIEQFRMAPLAHDLEANRGNIDMAEVWLVETVAGRTDSSETPEQVGRREAQEEAGCTIGRMHPMGAFYQSPGVMSEKIHYFCGLTDTAGVGGFHGLAHEHEDIRVIVVSRSEALQALADGKISNVTLAFALQWLELNRHAITDAG